MSNRILEICVETVDHAVAAERGGAHRIEFCSDLSCGGVTPNSELMQSVRRHVCIPIHILIRPRAGNFCYSDHELEIMRNNILTAKQFGMDGIVLGVLRESARVDVERTQALVELADPLPVTFHRAFDAVEDMESSLEDVIQTGAARILTSGGQARATDGISTLARLVQAARGRILLMPGGGVNSGNLVHIIRTTRAQEIHSSAGHSSARNSSAGTSNPDSPGNGRRPTLAGDPGSSVLSTLFEQKVSKLASLLGSVSQDERVS
jgi:copper homeostasis protein